jgi:hypothetical protein
MSRLQFMILNVELKAIETQNNDCYLLLDKAYGNNSGHSWQIEMFMDV